MSMKMHEIRELIRLVDESSIEEFEFENEGTKVMLKKAMPLSRNTENIETNLEDSTPSSMTTTTTHSAVEKKKSSPEVKEVTQAPVQEEEDQTLHKIVSPMVGTFYAAPSPDASAYVQPGDRVEEKSVVCIVEAMKLMNELDAEIRGEIVKVLVENGQLVEYGQPLFLVKAD